jgi:hypothetical protein
MPVLGRFFTMCPCDHKRMPKRRNLPKEMTLWGCALEHSMGLSPSTVLWSVVMPSTTHMHQPDQVRHLPSHPIPRIEASAVLSRRDRAARLLAAMSAMPRN